MKDNLIDEEKAKKEEAAQESLEQKLERIGRPKELFSQLLLYLFGYFFFQIVIWKIF